MPKHYVTFGQAHRHEIDGKIFDKDCVARFEAADAQQGRDTAFKLFGPQFCFEYSEDEFKLESMKYFPRGFVDID